MKLRKIVYYISFGLLILIVSECCRAETYSGTFIDSYTDGAGYFEYTIKVEGFTSLPLLTYGVYDFMCPDNWSYGILPPPNPPWWFGFIATDTWTQPGVVFALYSTSSEAHFFLIRAYHDLWGSWYSSWALGPVMEPSMIPAAIDLEPDTLNLKSKRKWITAYIEPPEDYDVEDIDISTVVLKKDDFEVGGEYGEFQEGVLMVKFPCGEVKSVLELGEIELTVYGELTDSTLFEGTDTIKVRDKDGGI